MASITGAIFGSTGSFKTANCGFAAKYIYKKTGLTTRYITADGGGYRPIQPLVDVGIIEPFSLLSESDPLFILRKIVDGWWPLELENGIRKSTKMIKNFKGIGAYIFEGATSISELYLESLRGKKYGMNPAVSEYIGAKVKRDDKGKVTGIENKVELTDEGGKQLNYEIVGSSSQDHFGIIQNEVMARIIQSWSLPVELCMWTGHEAQGTDEKTQSQIRGIGLVGNKGTPRIGKNIGFLIHFDKFLKEELNRESNKKETKVEVRAYFQSHPDQKFSQIFYDCKSRTPPEKVNELLRKFPGGYFIPKVENGLDEYMEFEDVLLGSATIDLVAWKKKIDDERNRVALEDVSRFTQTELK